MYKIGVLLTNTGTPDAPTTSAVRRYLREFLSDPRIVHIPRLIWLPLLYGLILPFRSRKSAALYKTIWTPEGAPMRTIMQHAAKLLQTRLQNVEVAIGMNYGNPSIQQGLDELKQKQVSKVVVLPLFPQYSNATTASTFDRVTDAIKQQAMPYDLSFIHHYAANHAYILALAVRIKTVWTANKPGEHLLISFHGLPERFARAGDPYADECKLTAQLIADELMLPKDKWTLCFQSQFGYDKWLKPSTQDLFIELPKRGITNVDIICPGFAIDCLETLEEINLRGRKAFLNAGGNQLRYIPALNDSSLHIDMLAALIRSTIGG
jgi:ferrochelatase